MTKLSSQTLTEGSICRGLLKFFIPIMLGTFFQQLYNTADSIIVGQFVGKEALAAVGGGTAIYVNLLVGFFSGLASGSSIVVSQFFGAKKWRELGESVHTAIWISLVFGVVMTGLGILLSPAALLIIQTPDEIFASSLSYLQIYFLGIIPMFIYNMGAGVVRATGDSKSPFIVLAAGVFVNVFLDLLFVAVLKLGVKGAALATDFCQLISALMILVRMKCDRFFSFSFRKISFKKNIFIKMMQIGFPSGLQSSLYTVSNLIIQSNINYFGTNAIAAWAAYGRIDGFFWVTVSSFGQSLTTFSGQNFGAGKIARMRKANNIGLALMTATAVSYTVIFHFAGRAFFRLFTDDADVVNYGMEMLNFLTVFYFTYIPVEVYSGTIHGTGDSFIPMIITLVGVCLIRVVWLFLAVPLHRTIVMVEACYPVTWIATSLAFMVYYYSGKWMRGKGNLSGAKNADDR